METYAVAHAAQVTAAEAAKAAAEKTRFLVNAHIHLGTKTRKGIFARATDADGNALEPQIRGSFLYEPWKYGTTAPAPLAPSEFGDSNADARATAALLPPLKAAQGPFRTQREVCLQRFRRNRPSLRVQTEYEAADAAQANLRERSARWIHDKPFAPSTQVRHSYKRTLRRRDPFVDGAPTQLANMFARTGGPVAFATQVPPIHLFEDVGRLY